MMARDGRWRGGGWLSVRSLGGPDARNDLQASAFDWLLLESAKNPWEGPDQSEIYNQLLSAVISFSESEGIDAHENVDKCIVKEKFQNV